MNKIKLFFLNVFERIMIVVKSLGSKLLVYIFIFALIGVANLGYTKFQDIYHSKDTKQAESMKKELDKEKTQILSLETSLKSDYKDLEDLHNKMIDWESEDDTLNYNSNVNKYNSMINGYNNGYDNYDKKIKSYNEKIDKYNIISKKAYTRYEFTLTRIGQ